MVFTPKPFALHVIEHHYFLVYYNYFLHSNPKEWLTKLFNTVLVKKT